MPVPKVVTCTIDLAVEHPGIHLFGAYAAYLLYRMTWLLNVSLWGKYAVQYIHFFKFGIIQAQTLRIFNEILIEVVIFLIFYVLFAESLTKYSSLHGALNPGYIALTALVAIVLKHAFHLIVKYGKNTQDRGVFTFAILFRCIMSPYYAATFRDKVAANILTSFSRPISDFLRATCWLVNGQVVNGDRYTTVDDVQFCEDSTFYTIIVLIQVFFGWIRMVQCLRGMKEANWKVYPNGLNASKYCLGLVLKLYILVFPEQSLSLGYIVLLVINSLFRWYWDVVMDWGMGSLSLGPDAAIDFAVPWGYPSDDELGLHTKEIQSCFVDTTRILESERQLGRTSMSLTTNDLKLSEFTPGSSPLAPSVKSKSKWKYFLLRPSLFLFDRYFWIYHIVIFLDLILRFFFVLSFLPQKKLEKILGTELPFYLGCFEILRRAMWMTFRLEWEHIKFVALCNERKKQLVLKGEVKNILHKLS
jgi:hypothetical protein